MQRLAVLGISLSVQIPGPRSLCLDLILSWCCFINVSLPSVPFSPSVSSEVPCVFLSVCPPLTSMSASLSATASSAQKVRIFHFGTCAYVAFFCFALQSATCFKRGNPSDCGDETPCAEEEPDRPGCPEGKGVPEFAPKLEVKLRRSGERKTF